MTQYKKMKALYLDSEKYDGYFRDRCVFGNDISIEDTMNVIVEYKSGALLSYSLFAYSPWEGYRIAFNGTRGRLEHTCRETSYINADDTVQGGVDKEGTSIVFYPHFKAPCYIDVATGEGGHGGGDIVMLDDIFKPSTTDKLMRAADVTHGAYSILVGIAANASMETTRQINISDLVSGLSVPEYPEMLGQNDQIPYVKKSARSHHKYTEEQLRNLAV